MNYQKRATQNIKIYFIGSFILIVLFILIYFYLKEQYNRIEEEAFEQLKKISAIKTESIINFINEEKYDLEQLVNSDFFRYKFIDYVTSGTKVQEFYKFLNDVKTIKHLEDIVFINNDGNIVFSFFIPDRKIDSITIKEYKNSNPSKIWIDIYKNQKSNIIYAFQFPVFLDKEKKQKLIGYIRFQYDALNSLIPRIDYFEPNSSKEILLLKNEENELIYLSYLRKIPVKPYQLRQIQSLDEIKILNSNEEIITFDGLDYSGTHVLAVFQKIPGTNWILMTKQDRLEVYQKYRDQAIFTIIVTFLILALIFTVFRLIIYRHNITQKLIEHELKKSRDSLVIELEMISNQVSDAIFILNSKGEIIKTSKSVEKIYGFKPEELKGKTIDIVCVVNEMNELFERFKNIEKSENYIYESVHRKKDGSLFDVEVNARSFKIGEEEFFIGSVRDISERKKTLNELERKLEVEQFLTEIASEMININYENFESNISLILGKIANFIKVERIRFFKKDDKSNLFNCELEWCKPGLEEFKEELQFLNIKTEFPYLYSIITNGKTFKCEDIDLLPDEAFNEKRELHRQGIKALCWKPLIFNGELKGFISCSTSNQKLEWKKEFDLLLNLFSEILINTLIKVDFETKLSTSEKRFKKLVENSSDVVTIISKDFRNIYISPSVKNVLGYSVEERLNQNPLELIHPDDLELINETLNSISNLGDKRTIQFRVRHKLGHYIWIEATLTNLYDDPLVNGLLVNYHDITDIKEAYKKLQESEERYRMLAEESGDVLYTLNYSTMKYEYLSPVIEKLTGYAPEEIQKIGFSNIVESISLILSPEKTINEIRETRIKGETGEYLADYKIKTKSGETKWVRDHSFPLLDSNGKLAGSIGILTDITEIKKIEDEIKKRESYLAALVDIQKSLIFLHDLNEFYNYMIEKLGKVSGASRCYVFVNSKDDSGKLLMSQVAEWCAEGVTPQINNPELQNLPYDVLGFDLYKEFQEVGYWAKIVEDLPEPAKSILQSQDIVSILLIPIMIQDEFYGFIGFDDCLSKREWSHMEIEILRSAATSISLAIESKRKQEEIIRAKDELIEANRLKSGFISLISHEIRTPLNSIIGFNEILRERFFNPEDKELIQFFDAIKNNSMRLLNTINQLLEISRLNAGALKVNIENLNLNNYISKVCKSLKVLADEKNLNLNCLLPEEDLIVLADEYCLHGILENLITNAIKYSERGTIEVSANAYKDYIELKVKDEGIGISEKYLKHLFNPFSQEDVSYKRPFEGTGLGLAITKKYVDLIGGEIRVESQKGIGTTFIVKLRKAKVE